jgi:LysM repeat protein
MIYILKIIILCMATLSFPAQAHANIVDPFTRSLGDGTSMQSKKTAPATSDISKKNSTGMTDNANAKANNSANPMPTTNSQLVPSVGPIGNILAPDPLISYDLEKYLLKGTALSSSRKLKPVVFNRQGKDTQIDYGNIQTTHRVKQNDTIESIASRYGYSSEEIKIANAIVPGSKLIVNTKIALPARIHVVQKKQNLTMIADLYNIDARDLAGFNDLNMSDELAINEKLLLPFYVYRTNKIQTMRDIAKQFNRTVNEIVNINSLTKEDVLDKGQYIKIPILVTPFEKQQLADDNRRSLITYIINPKNLAILEVNGQQFMVREGDSLGKNKGRIVKITSKDMKVLEDYEEFIFQINTPINQQVAYAPPATTTVPVGSVSDPAAAGATATTADPTATTADPTAASAAPVPATTNSDASVTNVEDLFK